MFFRKFSRSTKLCFAKYLSSTLVKSCFRFTFLRHSSANVFRVTSWFICSRFERRFARIFVISFSVRSCTKSRHFKHIRCKFKTFTHSGECSRMHNYFIILFLFWAEFHHSIILLNTPNIWDSSLIISFDILDYMKLLYRTCSDGANLRNNHRTFSLFRCAFMFCDHP